MKNTKDFVHVLQFLFILIYRCITFPAKSRMIVLLGGKKFNDVFSRFDSQIDGQTELPRHMPGAILASCGRVRG